MTTITEITVGESRKINLGNYESKEISIYLKANAANEDSQKLALALQDRIKALLDAKEKTISVNAPKKS